MAKGIRRKVLLREDFGLCVLWPKTAWGKVPQPGQTCVITAQETYHTFSIVRAEATARCSCSAGLRPAVGRASRPRDVPD